jgi:hypothetical protein
LNRDVWSPPGYQQSFKRSVDGKTILSKGDIFELIFQLFVLKIYGHLILGNNTGINTGTNTEQFLD